MDDQDVSRLRILESRVEWRDGLSVDDGEYLLISRRRQFVRVAEGASLETAVREAGIQAEDTLERLLNRLGDKCDFEGTKVERATRQNATEFFSIRHA